MTSKERILSSLAHKTPDRVCVDFGSTPITGMHSIVVEKLREHYGLEKRPVKIVDTFQMLGEVDDQLKEIMGCDVLGVGGDRDLFGLRLDKFKEYTTPWGQEVLVPDDFNYTEEAGDLYLYPQGDINAPPSGSMPSGCYFWNAIERQDPIDDNNLNVYDNLEEFGDITEEGLTHWENAINQVDYKEKAIVASFGGTALGDIALVPAVNLKHPKGIRNIAEWYMSTIMRKDYVEEIFDKQSDIAIRNLAKFNERLGEKVDIVYICGTDFGTQESLFCSLESYRELYKPYYQKINNWIHENTKWKTFKHSCGAVEPMIQDFIESGFDILNPVQINAKGMDSRHLKDKYGDKLTFWGGGVDTQNVLAFGTPEDVKNQVSKQCQILGENGGFVFNTVHNVQANTPIENVIAMIETLIK